MTWYFDPTETAMDVYDHEGTKVRADIEFGGTWVDDYPDMIDAIMRGELGDGQPSKYNQLLLADAATDNIEQGVPSP
jgi:hypothetical protein